jgi:hypothetical protein
MLRLVANNISSPTMPPQFQEISKSNNPLPFSCEIRIKGPDSYILTAQDSSRGLETQLPLKIEGNYEEYKEITVKCQFPMINDEALMALVDEDETLFGILMIQFQMSILHQLFLFCASHYATKLTICADEAQAEQLGIYQEFITQQNETLHEKSEKTEMCIVTNSQTFEEWRDFMAAANIKFGQSMWRGQGTNSVIRQYLKIHSVS